MKIYFLQFPLPIIIFLLIFISFASANFDFIVRISGTWAKLREYKWLVSVEPKERFECLMINKDNIKYEGKFFKENETNKDMLFNFKISGSKEGGWYLECELNKPPFIEQLLPNLEKQVRALKIMRD